MNTAPLPVYVPAPIIITTPPPVPRNCITQDGRRYCEDTPTTGHDIGVVLLVLAILVAYVCGIIWSMETDKSGYVTAAMALVPLILGAVIAFVFF